MKPAFPCRRRPDRRARQRACGVLLATTLLAGCMVGPDYHRPAAIQPVRLKEMAPPPGWVMANPHYAELPKGAWWALYDDPVLNGLEAQVDISNQNVKAAEAAYRQARALVDQTRSGLFPSASVTPSITRTGNGVGGTSSTIGTGFGTGSVSTGNQIDITNYSLGGSADWQLDVWGQIRRQVESSVAAAQVSAANLANARLSAQTTLASDYFQLRYQDSLQTLLNQFVAFYEQSATITRNQYNAGIAAPSDLLQAETLVAQTRAQAASVGIDRSLFEHAIAVLTGHAPTDLSLPPGALTPRIPAIPVTLPSLLLQRRPDIAAAERSMEQENALIGAAIAAFYPVISLSAAASYAGNPIGSLIQAANRTWSLGATAVQTLFAGGERTAVVRSTRAAFDESVANYRQTVLGAFQGLEDQLSTLRILEQEADAQKQAVDLANESVTVALNQYEAGTAIYTTVITTQTTALTNAETALGIQENRMTSSVALINVLGGGWDTSELPSKNSLQVDNPFLPAFIQPDRN